MESKPEEHVKRVQVAEWLESDFHFARHHVPHVAIFRHEKDPKKFVALLLDKSAHEPALEVVGERGAQLDSFLAHVNQLLEKRVEWTTSSHLNTAMTRNCFYERILICNGGGPNSPGGDPNPKGITFSGSNVLTDTSTSPSQQYVVAGNSFNCTFSESNTTGGQDMSPVYFHFQALPFWPSSNLFESVTFTVPSTSSGAYYALTPTAAATFSPLSAGATVSDLWYNDPNPLTFSGSFSLTLACNTVNSALVTFPLMVTILCSTVSQQYYGTPSAKSIQIRSS